MEKFEGTVGVICPFPQPLKGVAVLRDRRVSSRDGQVAATGVFEEEDLTYFGEAVDLACRLLDAPGFKKTLRTSVRAPAALVVSDDIFWSIVKHGYEGLQEETFRSEVSVQMAGRRRRGYVHLPLVELESAAFGDATVPFIRKIHAARTRTSVA